MKILILSDSHGKLSYMERAVHDIRPDAVIHLGDHIRDGEELAALFPRLPMLLVSGNCDYGAVDPAERLTELGGVRIFLTHGHCHGVKQGLLRLRLAAEEAGARVALFGHTHVPFCAEENGILLFNPGAAGGLRPSCGVLEIDQNGKISCRHLRLSDGGIYNASCN